MIRYAFSFVLLFSLLAAGLAPAVTAQAPSKTTAVDLDKALKEIETKIDARRTELGVPGVGLAIVKDGKVVYAKGVGFKDLEKKVPVTADTEFAIGSATKAFTALTVLMARDEGKLSLDDPPRKYLPYFKMSDPETDKNIQIRDLLCHSSGLNRTDLAMITGKLTRRELIEVAGEAKPTAKLREKFQYQNIMFAAAGEIAATVEKLSWNDLIASRILKPLGMSNTTTTIAGMEKSRDHAYGYLYNFVTKENSRVPYKDIQDVAPAGAINSSAADMAKWIEFVLAGGVAGSKRLVSESSYDEWVKPQMKISAKSSYGFGWFLDDWNGLKVVQHGGNIDGFSSMVAMIPEKNIGFVLLTNVTGTTLTSESMPIVWSALLPEYLPAQKTEAGAVSQPAKTPAESLVAARKLIGYYALPGGKGMVNIHEDDGKVTFNISGQPPYALAERPDGSFSMQPLPETFSIKPELDADGSVKAVAISQPQGNVTFQRTTPPDMPSISLDELKAKVISAAGGEKALSAVKTRVTTFDLDFENQGVRGHGTSYAEAPDLSAAETKFTALGKPIATENEYFDGREGSDDVSFTQPVKYSGIRLADVKLASEMNPLLNWDKDFKKIEITGVAKVGDEDAYSVRFTPNEGTEYTDYYSTKSFLLLKREGAIASSTSSQRLPFSVVFSDYRSVDGVMLPFKNVMESISNGSVVTTITSVKQNVPIDKKVFAPVKR